MDKKQLKKAKEGTIPLTDIIKVRTNLVKEHGKEIIPGYCKEKELTKDQKATRVVYETVSDFIYEKVPEIRKIDNQELKIFLLEKKPFFRFLTIVFLIARLVVIVWILIFALIVGSSLFSDGTYSIDLDTVFLGALFTLVPYIIVFSLEPICWYIFGAIEYEDLFSSVKQSLTFWKQ